MMRQAQPLKFLSVCSGIEAASVAWAPLGWRAIGFSEIEPFPCSLLAHHYPEVPNFGDMTTFANWNFDDAAGIDLLCGGTPCQSFSVAGLRAGLADPRGNLMLTYLAIAKRFRPRWLVWENVPGVLSSNGGCDFAAFLSGLAELGYGFAFRILDAQYFGVAQRRRRVFVVAHLGSWQRAAAVLFERHSLQGHPAPSRKARQDVAPSIIASAAKRGGIQREDGDGGLIPERERALTTSNQRIDAETETLLVTHALRGEGFDASEDGTGRGTPLVPVHCFDARQSDVVQYGPFSGPMDTKFPGPTIAFDPTQDTSATNRSNPQSGDPCHTLAKGAHAPAIAIQAGAVRVNPESGPDGIGVSASGVAYTVEARAEVQAVQSGTQVRRLTPRECERLQGFPDDYTLVPHRGKPAADGPRYKALGNSWAVPCARWIGERIAAVDAIPK